MFVFFKSLSLNHFWCSAACFCMYFLYLLILDPCLSMSVTVSCIVCCVTFSSSIGVESLLGGDVGLPLVDGKVSSVPVTALIVLISEDSRPSSVCNLLETMSLVLKISPFVHQTVFYRFETLDSGVYPVYLPQDISYYWTQNQSPCHNKNEGDV